MIPTRGNWLLRHGLGDNGNMEIEKAEGSVTENVQTLWNQPLRGRLKRERKKHSNQKQSSIYTRSFHIAEATESSWYCTRIFGRILQVQVQMPCSQDEKLLKEMLASITEKFHAAEDLKSGESGDVVGSYPFRWWFFKSQCSYSSLSKSPNLHRIFWDMAWLTLALKLTEFCCTLGRWGHKHRTWQRKLKSLRLW